MRLLITLLLTMHCLDATPAQTESEPTKATTRHQATLHHLKTVLWPQAYRTGDRDLLEQILAPGFVLITASGEWRGRARELEELADYSWTHTSFDYRIKRLEIFAGDSAIVAGEGVADGVDESGRYHLRYQSSNVLVLRDGRWQAVQSHVSGIELRRPTDSD